MSTVQSTADMPAEIGPRHPVVDAAMPRRALVAALRCVRRIMQRNVKGAGFRDAAQRRRDSKAQRRGADKGA